MPHELTIPERPDFEVGRHPLRIVDLFAGCGGLTLGVAQAARAADLRLQVLLAADSNADATRVYKDNFPDARVEDRDVRELFPGAPGDVLTGSEGNLRAELGPVDLLVGGPPCQGHSDLNNHTRRDDPKNLLYAVMARAAEVLAPKIVVIENVPAVLNDKHQGSNVVGTVRDALEKSGYTVAEAILSLTKLGVAQRRRRHILLASNSPMIHPAKILEALEAREGSHDLRWAIGDLADRANTGFHTAPRASETNLGRMRFLLEEGLYDLPNELRPPCHQSEHSYKSMYGRLRWNEPAQTITRGYGSIGQGRYMHPGLPRALTPHEAARIQGFPDYFDFGRAGRRGALAVMIANAVPPQLSRSITELIIPEMKDRPEPQSKAIR